MCGACDGGSMVLCCPLPERGCTQESGGDLGARTRSLDVKEEAPGLGLAPPPTSWVILDKSLSSSGPQGLHCKDGVGPYVIPSSVSPDTGCATMSRTYMSLTLRIPICKVVRDQVTSTGPSEPDDQGPLTCRRHHITSGSMPPLLWAQTSLGEERE